MRLFSKLSACFIIALCLVDVLAVYSFAQVVTVGDIRIQLPYIDGFTFYDESNAEYVGASSYMPQSSRLLAFYRTNGDDIIESNSIFVAISVYRKTENIIMSKNDFAVVVDSMKTNLKKNIDRAVNGLNAQYSSQRGAVSVESAVPLGEIFETDVVYSFFVSGAYRFKEDERQNFVDSMTSTSLLFVRGKILYVSVTNYDSSSVGIDLNKNFTKKIVDDILRIN